MATEVIEFLNDRTAADKLCEKTMKKLPISIVSKSTLPSLATFGMDFDSRSRPAVYTALC